MTETDIYRSTVVKLAQIDTNWQHYIAGRVDAYAEINKQKENQVKHQDEQNSVN